jgi:CRP-like cAMP-binding protein
MDLLERARTLAACPLFENLAPAVVIRLAERARAIELERGERRTTDEDVWVVASGSFAVVVREGAVSDPTAFATASIARKRGAGAQPGNALGLVRVIRPATPVVEVVAELASVLVGIPVDDVRDVLEEDPAALAAIADRLAALLLAGAG